MPHPPVPGRGGGHSWFAVASRILSRLLCNQPASRCVTTAIPIPNVSISLYVPVTMDPSRCRGMARCVVLARNKQSEPQKPRCVP